MYKAPPGGASGYNTKVAGSGARESRGGAGAPPERRRWAAALLVSAVTVLVFWPVLDNQFVNWDDDRNFLNNPHYRGLGPPQLRWMWTTSHLGHYHPLTWMSLGLDYALWGLDSSGYHLSNLILHAANAALFYLVSLRLLGGRRGAALLAALLFSLHPLRVESVAWVSERRDLLSGLFFLLSILAYLRAQQQGPRGRWLALSLISFAAALLSKVIAVSLPVVLLALDYYPLRRFSKEFRRACLEKIPYLALAAAAGFAALAVQRTGLAGFAEHVGALAGLRAGLSLYGLAFYLWKTVAPVGLYPQYVLPADLSPLDPRLAAGAAVVVAGTALAALLWRRRPAVAAVWACYVAGLLPVLSIARVDLQQFAADHHAYLATLGLALLASAGMAALPRRWGPWMAAALLIPLAVLTRRQIGVWRDSTTLWRHAVAGAPDSVVARNNLGEVLAAENRLEEAVPHFQRAIQIRPRHAHAHYNLGRAYQRLGRTEAAVAPLREAARIEPAFAAAHNDLANCYAALGRSQEALDHYRRALSARPDFPDAHYNLGSLLHRQGQLDQAISHYREALRLKPSYPDAHNNWGVALDALGRSAEAIEHYRQALALDPGNADAHNNLGVSLEAGGEGPQALAHYRHALRLNPSHADARANLTRLTARLAQRSPGGSN